MANDKPRVTATLAEIEAGAQSPEPFVLALPDSKTVTFPDLYDIPAAEGEKFMREMETYGRNDFKFLENWLTPKDFKTYSEAGIKLRVHAALMNQVLSYYQGTLGKVGEDVASRNS